VPTNAALPLRRKLAYACVPAVLLFLLFELAFHLVGPPTYWQRMLQYSVFEEADQPVAEWLRNHYQQPGRARRIDGSSFWLYNPIEAPGYTINEAGFRGPLPGPPRESEFRVLLLGGSTVYGWLVADGKTIPAYLEQELRALRPELDVTVINLGIEGFRFQQELELLEHVADELQPDLVVFYHLGNDALVALQRGAQVDGPSESDGIYDLVAEYDKPGLLAAMARGIKRSGVGSLGLWLRLRIKAEGDPEELSRPLPSELEAKRDAFAAKYVELLEQAEQTSARLGVPYAVFLQPLLHTKGAPWTDHERFMLLYWAAELPWLGEFYRSLRDQIVARTDSRYPLIDISDTFAGTEATVFQDQIHLTPAANRQIAARIAAELTTRAPIAPRAKSGTDLFFSRVRTTAPQRNK